MKPAANSPPSDPYVKPSAQYYTLFLLTVVNVFNLTDRQILSILQEPIKRDLGLSDSQLGLLTGLAFSLLYVTAGIPIARLADRSIRRNIIAWSLGIWSAMTAISGFTQNYAQLFMARVGVSIGEAGCSPPAHSMLSSIFPAEKRASVLSIYSTGINIGILFGFLCGGWLNHFFGWRMALVFVGAPGLVLALLVRFTVAEPVRRLAADMQLQALPSEHSQQTKTLKQVLRFLWSRKSFRYLAVGNATGAFVAYGVLNWIAPFLMRVHGMSSGELGSVLALTVGVSGGLGAFASGMVADRLAKRDKRWYAWLPALAMLISVPAYIAVFSLKDTRMIILVNVIPMFLMTGFSALSVTMIHGMVAPNMRATGSATMFLVASIFGLGLGPWLIGLTSDYLHPLYDKESIRYALLYIAPTVAVISGLLFWRCGHHLREDLANVPDW